MIKRETKTTTTVEVNFPYLINVQGIPVAALRRFVRDADKAGLPDTALARYHQGNLIVGGYLQVIVTETIPDTEETPS